MNMLDAQRQISHSQTDAVIESYIPTFRNSIRLQIVGLLMLPVFGLGLPLLLVGYRRKNHIVRLVEQSGMEKTVWIDYVRSRVTTFRFEQRALQVVTALVSLIAASVVVVVMLQASVLNEIGQFADDLSPADPASQRSKRANTSSGLHSYMDSSSKSTR